MCESDFSFQPFASKSICSTIDLVAIKKLGFNGGLTVIAQPKETAGVDHLTSVEGG